MVYESIDWGKYKYVCVVAFSKTGKTRRLQAKVAKWLKPKGLFSRLIQRHVPLPVNTGLLNAETWQFRQQQLDWAKNEYKGKLAMVLLIPTYLPTRAEKEQGIGVVPELLKKAVLAFTKGVPAGDVFIIGTGNRRFGPDYGLAAKKIANGLGVPEENLVLTENDLWPPMGCGPNGFV